MSKKVLLVGHCGPDSSYLKMAIKSAIPDSTILMADDSQELRKALDGDGLSLILFNRELGYGFDEDFGVDMIKWLKPNYPTVKMMLVSNYPDAQKAAEEAGAIPGFGKREIGSKRVTELLANAVITSDEPVAR
jgi:two-component system, chemotaxis family, chemotaxis protein CheY